MIALIMFMFLSGGQKKSQDHFDKNGCNTTMLGIKGCADLKKQDADFARMLDKHLYPRDLFHCNRNETCSKPIRGWALSFQDLVIFEGSVDMESYLVTAKKGTERQYFWMELKGGLDPETGQSLSSVRVKELRSLDESPYETDEMREGLWARDRSMVWMSGSKDDLDRGWCIRDPQSYLPTGEYPYTKEQCASIKESETSYTIDEKGNQSPPVKGKRVELVPWKQTSGPSDGCK
jgi:hypothetical protein